MNSIILEKLEKNLNIVLLLFFLLLSFFNVENLGISWDEGAQRVTGLVNYDYIFNKSADLLTYRDRDYGAFFELILIFFEKVTNRETFREIFLLRHLLSHLFFLVAANFFYKLILFLYNKKSIALLGMLFLLLTPRIYGHSFYNTKDIPFLSMLIISLYYMAVSFEKKTALNFLKLGVSVGLLINIRIMGIMLLMITPFFLIIDAIGNKKVKLNLSMAVFFISIACGTLYLSWPYLWESPFTNLIEAFSNMSKFRWDGRMLFGGEMIKGSEVKWYYIPKWISMTVPITYLLFSLIGILFFIYRMINRPKAFLIDTKKRNLLLYHLLFLGPIFIVVFLKSVLYDDWRQMYFIYPPLILILISFINEIKLNTIKKGTILIFSITLCFQFYFILFNAAKSPVYFNSLFSLKKGEYLSYNYEMDYWGTTFKKTMNMLLDTIESDNIKIYPTNTLGKRNIEFLKESQRKRIKVVKKENATFLITNYENKAERYKDLKDKEIVSLDYGDNKICTVYKIR